MTPSKVYPERLPPLSLFGPLELVEVLPEDGANAGDPEIFEAFRSLGFQVQGFGAFSVSGSRFSRFRASGIAVFRW